MGTMAAPTSLAYPQVDHLARDYTTSCRTSNGMRIFKRNLDERTRGRKKKYHPGYTTIKTKFYHVFTLHSHDGAEQSRLETSKVSF